MTAIYRCLKCLFSWRGLPGPTQCGSCGHLYVEWTNYGER